ncbi:aminopeptidase, partial [Peribacillus sp. SIMBA_075]
MWNGIHGYIGIHGETNDSEMKDVPDEKNRLYAQYFHSIFRRVDNDIKGIRINYPTAALAQKAKMPT